MSITFLPSQANRVNRTRNIAAQALALKKEIAALKQELAATTDTVHSDLLRRRIRGAQRNWLAKVRAIAKEQAQ